MAKLKKPRRRKAVTSARSAAAPEPRIPLALVVDGTARALKPLSDAERATIRELRAEADRAVYCGEFDPRVGLLLEGAPYDEWLDRRRAFLREHFRGDRRVTMERA